MRYGKSNDDSEFYLTKFNKPSIIASDAHQLDDVGTKVTWIKANPTFEGLKQIMYEPEDRVFIGEKPEVLTIVEENRTKYINSLEITQANDYDESNGIWFNDVVFEFNKELVAVIGNKGSGKSAITDILGLMGNTHNAGKNNSNFSFLNKNKFLRTGFANNFEAKITWEDKKGKSKTLNSEIDFNDYEKVRYLPQNYFETLTNDLENKGFIRTLQEVIFEHLPEQDKHEKSDFEDLIKYKSDSIEKDLAILREEIRTLNNDIVGLEKKEHPEYRKEIENSIAEKQRELDEHKKRLKEMKPVKDPSEDDAAKHEKSQKFEETEALNSQAEEISKQIIKKEKARKALVIEKEELTQILNDLVRFEKQFTDYKKNNAKKFKRYDLEINTIIRVEFDKNSIEGMIAERNNKIDEKKDWRSW